ncbi:hypothetical protein ACFSBZ_09805 [Amnibacterium flavum]|uniref:hypothetical protein n=1 Tax=Amnibacterium flavum TaxID=2173173 RepID=UPI0014041148|nr:hypothetical protein [Amnibacterium flavum]
MSPQAQDLRDEDGIGMIEIVVSMFVLGLLALAFLPLLANSLSLTSRNTTLAAATQVVERQLAEARAQTPSCAAIKTYVDTVPDPVDAGRGVRLQPQRSVGSCPSTFPGFVSVSSSVVVAGTSHVLASAATRIFVSAP